MRDYNVRAWYAGSLSLIEDVSLHRLYSHHDIGEGVVVVRSVERYDDDWSDYLRVLWNVGEADLCCWELCIGIWQGDLGCFGA